MLITNITKRQVSAPNAYKDNTKRQGPVPIFSHKKKTKRFGPVPDVRKNTKQQGPIPLSLNTRRIPNVYGNNTKH